MKDVIDIQRPWWKEPMLWMIFGLPLAAVVASFASYYIAATNPDPLVKAGYHKEGMAPVKDQTLEQKAAAMGLSAMMSATGDGRVQLVMSGGTDKLVGNLRLSMIHPTHVERDLYASMVQTDQNTYVASVGVLDDTRRQIIIEPEDLAWRLTGYWQSPLSGPASLGATSDK